MRTVIKVVVQGAVTSFRYPHFVQGVQPTYEMPPPSTIYGHLCSAVGRLISPDGIRFALHFTYEAKFRDLEHLYLDVPYVQPIPFTRELLFNPHLTLYFDTVDSMDLLRVFREPRYPVILGRSQDLMTYTFVNEVQLINAESAYFEHTLVPAQYAYRFGRTIAVTMARYIDQRRHPQWGIYAILKDRVVWPDNESIVMPGDQDESIWVDPDSPERIGDDGISRRLGLVFHTLTGEMR
ncbi:MAG: CRISPR-associated protein Cas5 [Aggregatilineales bacterium]